MTRFIPALPLIAAALAAWTTPAQARPGGFPADPAEMLKKADLDHDGRITRAEARRYRATQWERMDRNGDGAFSRDDLPGMLQSRWDGDKMVRLRQAIDTNRDNRVSRAEFLDGPMPGFDMADANNDAVVTTAEREAFVASVRAQRGG